jgi:hypothetical protein
MNFPWTKLRRGLLLFGFGGGVLLLLGAAAADRLLGQEVLMIVPHDASTVELNRALYLPGDPVADLYGNPMTEPVRVLMPAADRLLRPEENPSLLLLQVDKQLGENPLQSRTIWFFARYAVPGAFLVGILGLVVPRGRSVEAPLG